MSMLEGVGLGLSSSEGEITSLGLGLMSDRVVLAALEILGLSDGISAVLLFLCLFSVFDRRCDRLVSLPMLLLGPFEDKIRLDKMGVGR